MHLIRSRKTKLYLNQDEVIAASNAYDYVLINPELGVFEAIGSKEALVWKLLQHKHDVAEIVAHVSLHTGQFENNFVRSLIAHWQELGLVHEKSRPFWHRKPKPWWQRLIWQEVTLKHFDSQLSGLYRKFLHLFTVKWLLLPYSVLITAGMLTLVIAKSREEVTLLSQISLSDFILIFSLGIVILCLHEMGHAIAMKWAGAEVLRAGFALYLGLPVFFVDTSTVWAKARLQRIVTASGGIIVNLLIASILVLANQFISNEYWKAISWELVLINLFMVAISSVPFVKMDGYYILVDVLGIPKLDQKAYTEIKQTLKHPWPIDLRRSHLLLVVFGIISLICSVLLTLYAAWYWWGLAHRIISFL